MDLSTLVRSEPVDEVIVLGAGFSKAISSAMPIADELGWRASDRAGIEGPAALDDGWFEMWLSRLAERQPDLTYAENAANAERYARLIEVIYLEIFETQESLQGTGIPDWLYRLVGTLHYRRSKVASFNYDTLVEWALDSRRAWDFQFIGSGDRPEADEPLAGARIGWHDALAGVPPLAGPDRMRDPLVPTFRLLKLHGSVNWYWAPGDASGATLQSWNLRKHDEERRRRYLPGREPFIVPPASAKSGFFDNPVMREVWRRCREALAAAERVHFVGYSLPPTDVLSSSMVGDAIGADTGIVIANPAWESVEERLKSLSPATPQRYPDVEDWSDALAADTSKRLIATARNASVPDAEEVLLAVGWDPQRFTYVSDVSVAGSSVVVAVADPRHHSTAQRANIARLATFVDAAESASSVVVRFANGRESQVIGIDGFGARTGPGEATQILIPADSPHAVGFERRSGPVG